MLVARIKQYFREYKIGKKMRIALSVVWGIVLTIYTNILTGQTYVKFKVRDSETGIAIKRFTVVAETEFGRNIVHHAKDSLLYSIPFGSEVTFSFAAPGYKPITTHFKGDSTMPYLFVEVNMDPVVPEPLPEAPLGWNAYQIFVIDANTWEPIADADVRIEFNYRVLASGRSNSKGELLLLFENESQSVSASEDIDFATLIVSKEGYCIYKKMDIVMNANSGRFIIELTKNNDSSCETVEFEEPGALQGTQLIENPSSTSYSQSFRSAPSNSATIQGFIGPPSSIRVGRNCQCTSCSWVSVLSLETYVRRGLDDEWIASWADHSLRSGAIPYRSYGAWHVYNPIRSNYDICSTPCCQAFQYSDIYAKTSNAAIYVAGFMLGTSGGSIAKAFYSAENNRGGGTCSSSNWACSDGWAGRPSWSPSFPCIQDGVCSGSVGCGHGAGECQWGSKRWADQGRTWKWIVEHYYDRVNWSISSPLKINSASVSSGSCLTPGCTMTISLSVYNAAEYSHSRIMIGASIYNGQYYSDPLNDQLITATVGNSSHTRNFVIPSNAPAGTYDLVVALWFDVDENNQINSGDLLLHSYTINNAITVVSNPTNLSATSQCTTGGISVQFSWNGSAPCYMLDISTDPNFSWYYSKNISNSQTTSAPAGFTCVTGGCPYGYTLTLQHSQTYYWRIRTDCGFINGGSFTTPSKPSASFVVNGTCVNNPVQFNSTSSGSITSYFWDFGDGNTGTGSSIQHQYVSTGPFTVTHIVTNSQGCKDTTYQTLTLQSPPTAGFTYSIQSGYTVSFHDQSQNATSWLWNFGDGNTSTVQNPTHTYASAGTYIVTQQVTNQCGNNTTSDTITFISPISVVLDRIDSVSCYGYSDGAIYISVNGGVPPYSYSWSNGSTSQDLINIPAGTYSCTITDAGGNTFTVGPYIVPQPSPLALTIDSVFNVKCHGESTGAIFVHAIGGTPPYTYNWSNGHNTNSLTNIPAGQYIITILDANSCSYYDTFIIQQPPALSLSIDTSSLPTLIANVWGGVPPYVCMWNTGDSLCNITADTNGIYIVTVYDSNGCTVIDTVYIGVEPPETPSASEVPDWECGLIDRANSLFIMCPYVDIESAYLVNALGMIVDKINIQQDKLIVIDKQSLPEGIYSVVIKVSSDNIAHKFIFTVYR